MMAVVDMEMMAPTVEGSENMITMTSAEVPAMVILTSRMITMLVVTTGITMQIGAAIIAIMMTTGMTAVMVGTEMMLEVDTHVMVSTEVHLGVLAIVTVAMITIGIAGVGAEILIIMSQVTLDIVIQEATVAGHTIMQMMAIKIAGQGQLPEVAMAIATLTEEHGTAVRSEQSTRPGGGRSSSIAWWSFCKHLQYSQRGNDWPRAAAVEGCQFLMS